MAYQKKDTTVKNFLKGASGQFANERKGFQLFLSIKTQDITLVLDVNPNVFLTTTLVVEE